MHTTGIEGEGFQALVSKDGFCREDYRRECYAGVNAGWVFGDVGVGGGGVFLGRGYGGFCFRLVCLGMGYSGVGCKIEAMYGWGWIPRFALEDV